jgi:hypothetical protein
MGEVATGHSSEDYIFGCFAQASPSVRANEDDWKMYVQGQRFRFLLAIATRDGRRHWSGCVAQLSKLMATIGSATSIWQEDAI